MYRGSFVMFEERKEVVVRVCVCVLCVYECVFLSFGCLCTSHNVCVMMVCVCVCVGERGG